MTRPAQLRKESFSAEGLGSARRPEAAYGQVERKAAEEGADAGRESTRNAFCCAFVQGAGGDNGKYA